MHEIKRDEQGRKVLGKHKGTRCKPIYFMFVINSPYSRHKKSPIRYIKVSGIYALYHLLSHLKPAVIGTKELAKLQGMPLAL